MIQPTGVRKCFGLFALLASASLLLGTAFSAEPTIDLSGFLDVAKHWNDKYGRDRDDQVFAPHQYMEIADNIVTFQNDDGGWSKSFHPLLRIPENELRALLGQSLERSTLDNRTTYTHVAYLANVFALASEERFKAATERGLDYILREQRSTGGWRGADVDAITYNDDVMIGVMRLLRSVKRQQPNFQWLDDKRRAGVSVALDRAIDVTLKCQIDINGVKTAWCQQHCHETYQPVKARSYELPSICPVESSEIVRFLMEIDRPSPAIIEAIEAAVAWLDRSKLTGIRVHEIEIEPVRFDGHTTSRDRIVVEDPSAKAIWARFYEIETNRPFFCNRDGFKVYSLSEVQLERRTGYGWYSTLPRRVLAEDYPSWKANLESSDTRHERIER